MLILEKFNVRMVFKNEGYGIDDSVIHDKDRPLVEFYDNRHGTGRGQFVSRYYASTLMESENRDCGLSLHGGVPEWTVSAEEMVAVRKYIKLLS
jgi:hypothetical protein